MTNDYTTEINEIASAMNAVYENKQVNKKDNISGDFSTDTASYPTVKAVKGALDSKVSATDIVDNLTTANSSKVLSAKQGKNLQDNKVDITQSTANRFVVTDNSKNISLKEKLGNITIDGTIGNASNKIITTTTNGVLQASDDISVSKTIDENANSYTHIGALSSSASQQDINSALNSVIGALKGVEFIKITNNKGTASADTMNKLFIDISGSTTDIYYTKSTTTNENTTYSWVKLEDNILEDISVDWSDITNKPSIITQNEVDASISDFANALANRINPSI